MNFLTNAPMLAFFHDWILVRFVAN